MTFTVADARAMLKEASEVHGNPERLWVMNLRDFDALKADSARNDASLSFDLHGEDAPRLLTIEVYIDDAQPEPALLHGADVATFLDTRGRSIPPGHPAW
ncbi:hypothetical protein [Brevundimonas sp.]|uniref:hypothetical protein n=1 Tax=Brevundimonas sp. TaxID=1871086 RepID=UPI00286C01A0|nr:hypothetical protein [Brevundimonas sp.]